MIKSLSGLLRSDIFQFGKRDLSVDSICIAEGKLNGGNALWCRDTHVCKVYEYGSGHKIASSFREQEDARREFRKCAGLVR